MRARNEAVLSVGRLQPILTVGLQSPTVTIELLKGYAVLTQGPGEAPSRKYKRLKLGGGHVYDYSSV
jgi:hypothetical protein